MKFKLTDAQSGKLLIEDTYPKNFDTSLGIEEFAKTIKGRNYTIVVKETWFSGTHISHVKTNSEKQIQVFFENDSPNIAFLFCLEGGMKCSNETNGEVISLSKNQQSINLGLKKQVVSFSKPTEYLYIQLTDIHYRNLTGVEFKKDISYYDSQAIEPEIRLILNAIVNQTKHKRILRIYMEAKIYELLFLLINKAINKTQLSLKKHDIDKILMVKRILEENIQSPGSLIELSHTAGINDYKLKIGFKELTGYTVFGYLNKIRMEKAFYYLSAEKKSVSEVSYLVGYKNAQHFTVAFKKVYNILPGSLNKNKFFHANV
ncbi:AraC family transcriptional regulator [Pedobacter aquatilis]|uniref:helix-turn-helix domain-containing protein n=1 Tax=Pedobacter aquatilis TaxID=351343 RepID=UPI002931882F|nr:AraC family transcriptional regulator [Pedobacter aquatilis]